MDNISKFDPIVVVKEAAGQRPSFFKRIRAPFSKLSLPNKKMAGAILALLLVFGVGLGVFLVQRQTQLRPRASANGVDLKIEPAAFNAALNQEFDLGVVLDAKQASASAAQVKITFDSQKLQLVSTTLGSYMSVALQAPQAASGSVDFIVGTSTPKGGSGTIATLKFKALVNNTTATVNFDANNTIVTVVNLNTNQAGDLTPAQITIGNDPSASTPPAQGAKFDPDTAGTLTQNLVAYWKFDGTAAEAVRDSTSNAFNLTVTSPASVSTFTPGKIGNSLTSSGSGSGSFIQVAANSQLDFGPNDSVSTSFWLNPTSLNNYVRLVGATNTGGYFLTLNPQKGLRLESYGVYNADNTARLVVWDNVIDLNSWHHYVVSYNKQTNQAVLYKDGVSVGTKAYTSGYINSADTFYVGGDTAFPLFGKIDEVGVWKKALTAQEAGNLYNGGAGNTYQPAVVTPEASLSLTAPETANVGTEFSVTVKARSDTEAANLFVSKINFPANLVEVVSISTDDSIATSWAEKFFDNTTGQISLAGGVPNPGYKTSGTAGTLAKITFRAKFGGTANLDMTDQSQIFSNATNANIIGTRGDASVVITGEQIQSPPPSASPSPSPSSSTGASPSPIASGDCATLRLPGDGNHDCKVDLTDLSILLSNFSALNPYPNTGLALLDFNTDGKLNSFDFSAMADKLFQLQIIRRRS